ncbi:unnamed protein product [Alternaria burnsii]|nr:unnamed protein product [Alternaria burnsii]
MEKLRRRDGVARKNICRIVLPYSEVQKRIAKVKAASQSELKQAYSSSDCGGYLTEHWRVHTTEKTKGLTNDLRCYAMINIFSEALSGQHYLGEAFLFNATKARIEAGGSSESKDIQVQDVLDAIQTLSEAADAIDSTWDGTKGDKAIGKRTNRKEEYTARKKGEAAAVRYNDDAEHMGEDAAEAAYPGRGKGKAVGMLTGRLEKTMLPDNFMSDDYDDEDDSDYVERVGAGAWRISVVLGGSEEYILGH